MKSYQLGQVLILALASSAAAHATVIYDITSALTLSNPTQTGRLSRNSIPQDWSGGETFPGVINTTVAYHYNTYTFNSGPTSFLQIEIDSTSANDFVSAYLGSYQPDSATTGNLGFDVHWLGDAGQSGNYFGTDPLFFQVLVPQFSTVVLVVNNTAASNVGVGDSYHITVDGFYDSSFSEVFEPASIALFAGGALSLLISGKKRRQRA